MYTAFVSKISAVSAHAVSALIAIASIVARDIRHAICSTFIVEETVRANAVRTDKVRLAQAESSLVRTPAVISARGRVAKNIASLAVELGLALAQARGVIARAVNRTIRTRFVLALVAIIGRKTFAACSQWVAKAVV